LKKTIHELANLEDLEKILQQPEVQKDAKNNSVKVRKSK